MGKKKILKMIPAICGYRYFLYMHVNGTSTCII